MTVPGAQALARHIERERLLREWVASLDAMYPGRDSWSDGWHEALRHVRQFLDKEVASYQPVCPSCQSDNWDWYENDRARCRDCGGEWTQPTEEP